MNRGKKSTSGSLESRAICTAIRIKKVGHLTSRLSEEHFTGTNRKVFRYLREHWGRHRAAPSLRFVSEKFPTFNTSPKGDGKDFEFIIDELIERSSAAAVAEMLRESAKRLTDEKQVSSPAEVMDELERSIRTARAMVFSSDVFKMRERAADFLARDYEMILERDGMLGIPVGIEALDKSLHGFKDGELISILGFAGEGKTYLSLLIAGLLWKQGTSVSIFSLEMDSETIARRLYAVIAGISIEDYLSGVLEDDEIDRMETLAKEVEKWKSELIIDDEPILSVSMLKSKLLEYKTDVAIIDYLGLIQGQSSFRDKNQKYDELIKGVKLTARELKMPIIANSQATKDAGDSRIPPKLSQVAGGMPLSKAADVILAFCRTGSNYTIAVRKNRNAVTLPVIKLVWSLTEGAGLLVESKTVQEFTTDI